MRLGRALGLTLLGLLTLALLLALAAYGFVRASLPALDGSLSLAGLDAAASIERDENGIPTVRAGSRADLAFAIGFVHAQDRFFQMDLLRRAGSGELAALLGPRLLPVDRERRLHRFTARARALVAAATGDDKRFVERYTEGVNAGLASLGARPFEYAVLRTLPAPWRAEDTVLVLYAMYFDLQEDQLHRVYARGWLRDHGTSAEQLAFLLPTASVYDAPLDAATIDAAPLPIPATAPLWFGKPLPAKSATASADDAASLRLALAAPRRDADESRLPADALVGSNNFAIAGSRSKSGAAIVSDDMHLGLRLPNTWHRLFAEVAAPPGGVPAAWRAGGVMIPGAPAFVSGSNGRIAWGMTNSYGHYLDLLEVELDPNDPSRYRNAAGWASLRFFDERIEVSGGAGETLRVAESEWGPIWQRGGHHYAVRWLAHDIGAADFRLRDLDQASDVAQALQIAQKAGLPTQNFVAGDSGGHIGWTLAGPLPGRDSSWANTFPSAAAAASSAGWSGFAPAASHPTLVDPPSGQLWTANARQLAGEEYAHIGDGGADLGARGQQARDGLSRLGNGVVEAGVYGVAVDDRALYLAPWRERALRVLADDRSGSAPRAEFARLLQTTWSGRASTESVAYRLTRAYYNALYRQLFGSVDESIRADDKGASFSRATQRWPVVVARLLDEQPQGWLPEGRANWQAVQLAAIDDAIAEATQNGATLAEATWGRRNTAHIAHPLASSLPWGARWLAAPAEALPGDNHMPRVAAPEFGQSERFVVSPGHEAEAIFNMPGGASGHPLSSYFLAGHSDWANGRPSGFVPQKQAHLLTLLPTTRP